MESIAISKLPPEAAAELNALDTDGDGIISPSEIVAEVLAKREQEKELRTCKRLSLVMVAAAVLIIGALAGTVFGIVESERRMETDGDELLAKNTGNMVKVKQTVTDVPLGALFDLPASILAEATVLTVQDMVYNISYTRYVKAITISDAEATIDFTDDSKLRIFRAGVAVFIPAGSTKLVGVCPDCSSCGFRSVANKDVADIVDRYYASVTKPCASLMLEHREQLEGYHSLFLPEEFYTWMQLQISTTLSVQNSSSTRRRSLHSFGLPPCFSQFACEAYCNSGRRTAIFPLTDATAPSTCSCTSANEPEYIKMWFGSRIGFIKVKNPAYNPSPRPPLLFDGLGPVPVAPSTPSPPAPAGSGCQGAPAGRQDVAGNIFCDGNGYRLALYIPASIDTLSYDDPVWTTPGSDTVDTSLTSFDAIKAKNAIYKRAVFQENPFSSIKVAIGNHTLTSRAYERDSAATTLEQIFLTQGAAVKDFLDGKSRVAVRNELLDLWFPDIKHLFDNQPHCNLGGFNVRGGVWGHKCRFGMWFNNENACTTMDTLIGFGCYSPWQQQHLTAGGLTVLPDFTVVRHPKDLWIWVK
eukprot:TRINITY_DN11925_c0_g1_i3.p2 TRINITY_DN11925_c0_g1~~TRINITY_DN11925_c0_g1_i3.p2  ORF type:complete len:583 (+),score=91.20 TRINITY_DN11925_c0_g1_i3:2919-4667(+)